MSTETAKAAATVTQELRDTQVFPVQGCSTQERTQPNEPDWNENQTTPNRSRPDKKQRTLNRNGPDRIGNHTKPNRI